MALRTMLCCIAGLVLASCAVGPDYRQPEVKLPDQWQTRQLAQLTNLQEWWAQFDDPALSTLQRAAQQNSNSLAKAVAAIDKARANRTSAGASLFPSLYTNGQATESGVLNNNSNISRTASVNLDASWELDLWGKTRRKTESADALISARQADWHDARVSLAAEVASDYVDYRACRVKQLLYEDQVVSQELTASLTRISAEAGFTARADAQLADASTASTAASALAQKVECEVLIKSLVALTSLDEPSLRQTLSQNPPTLPTVASGLRVDSLSADLLRQRPDLVVSERELASASALIGAAEAERYPSLTLSGSIGVSRTQGASLTKPWSFGPAVSLPIFDGGAISANIQSARADYDSALATYRQSVIDAVKEVEQAMVRLDSYAQREAVQQKSVEGYRAYLDATEKNLRAGNVSQLDYETARRSSLSAEISLIELKQSRLTSWIALYKAVGGGWQGLPGDAL